MYANEIYLTILPLSLLRFEILGDTIRLIKNRSSCIDFALFVIYRAALHDRAMPLSPGSHVLV